MPLEPAPKTPWNSAGEPRLGTYAGECSTLPFDEWIGRLDRVRSQKRWQWFGAVSDDVAVGGAIVRTGYAGNVFCWVFDRTRGEFLADVTRVVPLPAVSVASCVSGNGLAARYQAFIEGFEVIRVEDTWRIEGKVGDVRLDLVVTESGTPATAICPSASTVRHAAHVTRKQAVATASGRIRSGSSVFDLSDAPAFLDYSHGILAGETIWQWAIGSGTLEDGSSAAFNVVAAFNDAMENVVWIDGTPRFVGEVHFELPEDLRYTWRVEGDGLSLELDVEAVRAQELDLGLVASDYAQPLGVWRGTIDGQSFTGVGVAENHRSVW